jgi:uncharacterized membrane protein
MLRAYEDFPQFMQSLWSSLHDRFMNITFTRFPGEGHSFFAKHFQPFLLLLFPFYVIFKNGGFLIVLNVLAVGFAAVPLYLIVRERLKHTWLALAIAFVYLFSPLIQRGTLYDFHPESFVPLFLFWAFYFMQRDRPLLHWGTCFLLLTVKEDCFIHVTLLGLYGILFEKKRKLGGVTAIMAILWGVLSYAWIIPFFKGGKSHIFSGRYGKFSADNLFDLIYNILANPDKVVELLVSPDIILGILFLSMPLLLLPWLSLRGLFLILPLNLEFFLSSFVPVRLLVVHYSFLVLPNYLIGAILTVEGYLKNPRLTGVKLSSGLVGYFLTCAIFFNFFFAPYRSIGYGPMEHEVLEWSPLGRRFDIHYYTESAHHKIGREFIKKYIPERVSLSTVYNFATHLSNRRILRVFANTQGAELVFIDFFCENPNKFFNFGHLFFRQSVARLLLNSSYGVMKYHDGYTLLKKGFSKGKNMRVLRELMTKHSATDFDSDIGRTRPDPAARNHIARVADAKWDREGILVSSPKWNLPEGNYRAIFKLKTSHNDIDKPIAEILITTMNDGNTEVVSSKTLKGKDFYFESHYQDFLMGFDARGLKEIQMKIRFLGEGDLWFGGLDLKIPQLSSNQINNFLKQKRIRF